MIEQPPQPQTPASKSSPLVPIILGVVALLAVALAYFMWTRTAVAPTNNSNQQPSQSLPDGRLSLDSPKEGSEIGMTFEISGRAQNWFEGTVPVKVVDALDSELYSKSFIVPDNYESPASFKESIALTKKPAAGAGRIIFTDYSAKDGSVVYQKVINIHFSSAIVVEQSDWKTYSNTKYSFSLRYPQDITFVANKDAISQSGLIPVCDLPTIGCLVYPRDKYSATNFEGAGISINTQESQAYQNKAGCETINAPDPKTLSTKEINGVTFHTGTAGGAAAGHSVEGHVYRTFYNNICFELVASVAQSNFSNYPAGSIKEFSATASEVVFADLDQIIETFKFTK